MDPAKPARAGRKPVHIGLNLIFLVPGETGGMEVCARELIPALLDGGAGDPLHGVRQPRGAPRRAGLGTSFCPR